MALPFAILFISILLPLVSLAQQPDSTGTQLEQYLRYAAQHNPGLKAQFYRYRSTLARAPQVGTLPDPEIMFMYFANPRTYTNPLNRLAISATQKFPWFGSLETAEQKAGSLAKSELAALLDLRNELFRDIKKTWFLIYETEHHLLILRQNLQLLNTLETRALTLYETGNIGQVDVIRLQMEIDRLQTRIQQMENKLKPLHVEFNTLLNRDVYTKVRQPSPMDRNTLAVTPDRLMSAIKARNPELTGLDFRLQAADLSVEQARENGLPSFGAGVEVMLPQYMYMPMMPGKRTSVVAKLSVKLPLYRSRYRAERREARLARRSIKEQKNRLLNSLVSKAEKLLQDYRDAQYRINLYEERLIPKTRQALDISIESYSAEAANFEELINLQQQLLDYEMGLNTAIVEQNIAVAAIEALYGKYNISLKEAESIF